MPDIRGEIRHKHEGNPSEASNAQYPKPYYQPPPPPSLTFTSQSTTNVTEGVSPNTVVYTALAVDFDGSNDDVIYRLSGADAVSFYLNGRSGVLSLNNSPDYETQPFYFITIIAESLIDGVASATIDVTVTVDNVDDYAPAFTASPFYTTPQLVGSTCPIGTTLFTANATDSVDFTDGVVTYSASSEYDSAFTINPNSGTVTLASQPGNGSWGTTNSSNILTITASDATGNTASQTIEFVGVVGPSLGTTASAVSESKPAIGADGIVDASDVIHSIVSSGYTRSDLSFEIVSDTSNKFGVVASGADATVGGGIYLLNGQELDHETNTSHDIQIRAVKSDLTGNPGIISPTVTLTIPVTDVQPIITSGGAVASIDENSGTNQVIYTATATDADLQSGNITFSLEAGSDSAISIDSSTGEVTLTDDPDYETQNAYSFTVVGTNDQSDSASQALTLNIGNTIDIAPTFSSSNVLRTPVAENLSTATIYSIPNNIVNPEGATFTLSIASVDTGFSGFVISGANNDTLSINSAFDYETATSHDVTIQMNYTLEDGSTGNTTFVVEVPVANVDEVAPTFTSGTNAGSIAENSGANQVVYTATVDDSTDYVSGDVTFAMGASNVGDNTLFTVNPTTGEVTLTENPDYEFKQNYVFSLTATDAAGNIAGRSVLLTVTNVADIAPTWSTTSVTHSLSENTSSLVTLQNLNSLTVNNDNATIVYSILSGGSTGVTSFDILGTNLRLATRFDHENATFHAIVVRMSYTLGDGSTGSTNLTVNLIVTDEGIVFNNPNPGAIFVGEGLSTSTTVYNPQVVINDPQETLGDVTYTLSGPDGSDFNVNASDGTVRFNSPPDNEQKNTHNFILSASLTDYGLQTDTVSSSTVTIFVANTVEVPEFTSATSGVIYEKIEGKSNPVIYVSETIIDSTASSVTYTLGGTDYALLSVNSSGEVSITGTTNYSSKSQYDFTVTATDDLNQTATTSTLSAVIVEDYLGAGSGNFIDYEMDEVDVKAEHGQYNADGLLGSSWRTYNIKRQAVGDTSYTHYASTMVTVSCDGDFRGKYSSTNLTLQTKTSDQNNSYYTEGEEYKTDLIVYVNGVNSESYYYDVNVGSSGTNSITATGQPSEDALYLNTHGDSTLRNSIRIKHSTDTAGISSMATATPTGTECVFHEGTNTSFWEIGGITGSTENVSQIGLGFHAYIINNGNGTISFANSLANANAGVKAVITSYAAAQNNTTFGRINKVLHKQPHYATAVDNPLEATNATGLASDNRIDYAPNSNTIDFTFQLNAGSASVDFKIVTTHLFSNFTLAVGYTTTFASYKTQGKINLAPPTTGDGQVVNALHADTGLDLVQTVYFNEVLACTLDILDFNYISAPSSNTVVHDVRGSSPDNSSITYAIVSHSGFTFSGSITINSTTGDITFPSGITGTGTIVVRMTAPGHIAQDFTITAHEVVAQSIDGNWGNITMRYNESSAESFHVVDIPYNDTFTAGDLYHLIIRGKQVATGQGNYRNDVAVGWVQIFDSSGNMSSSHSFGPYPSVWRTSATSSGSSYSVGSSPANAKVFASTTIVTDRDGTTGSNTYSRWNHHDNTLQNGTKSTVTGPNTGFASSSYQSNKMPLYVSHFPIRDKSLTQVSGGDFIFLEGSNFITGSAQFLKTISTFTPPDNGTIRMGVHWYTDSANQTIAKSNDILDIAFAQA